MAVTERTASGDLRIRYDSAWTAVATPIEETLSYAEGLVHISIGCLYQDSVGDLILPTAGSVTIQVKTENTEQWEDISDNQISCPAPDTKTVAGNIKAVKVTPTGILGNDVQLYKLVVTANRGA